MGNCIVTKLAGEVNNDNLEIFDTVKIKVTEQELKGVSNNNTQQKLTFRTIPDETITVYVDGNGYFVENYGHFSDVSKHKRTLDISSSEDKDIWIANADYNLYIKSKNKLTVLKNAYFYGYFSMLEFDKSLRGCLSLDTLQCGGKRNSFDMHVIPDNVVNLNLDYMVEAAFDISEFSRMTDLETLTAQQNRINGYITDISNLIKLSSLNISGPNTLVTGSVEEFVEAMISNGRSSGTLTFNQRADTGLITLNNIAGIAALSIAFSGATATVTNNGNIVAIYNGSTWSYNLN